MAGAAPTETTETQHKDQQEADLYNKMAPEVEQATGQSTTPASLKPEDETALEKIEEEIENFFRYHGSKAGEAVGGKERDADVMTSKGNEAVTIVRKRGLGTRFLNRLGLKKAA